MTRAEVLAALLEREVDAETYGEDQLTATGDEWELDFTFTTDGADRLCELSVDGGAVLWAGEPLSGLRVDAALRRMEPHGPVLWTTEDMEAAPAPAAAPVPEPVVTDEKLLQEGTLWLPERGLGLLIYGGAVFGVVWRATQDLPGRFLGAVTAAQRELSLRPDLEDYLQAKHREAIHVELPKDPLRYLRRLLTVAALVLLALTARAGFEEMRRWNEAPVLPGKFVGFEKGPRKQFLDYLPPAVTKYLPEALLAGNWSGVRPQVDLFRVEYQDPAGQRAEARLEGAEFYVAPREIGDEAQVTYVAGEPPRVKGPARARDSAFMDHLPWVISIGALWLLGQAFISCLPLLRPLLVRLWPKATVSDPHRPELR